MARPTKAIVDYFPMDCAMSDSLKIIESKFGNDGFAFWVKLLQKLGRTENHFIDCRNISKWKLLSAEMLVDEDKCMQILKELSELGCIDSEMWNNKIIFSQKFINGLADVYKRRNVNLLQKNDICKLLSICSWVNVSDNPQNVDSNPQSKLNNTKQDKSKEEYKFPISKPLEKNIPKEYKILFLSWLGIYFEIHGKMAEASQEMQFRKLMDIPKRHRIKCLEAAIAGQWKNIRNVVVEDKGNNNSLTDIEKITEGMPSQFDKGFIENVNNDMPEI